MEAGADVVLFSGDKLLGGPQAGILLGSRAAVDAMRGNPLARVLRLDKMSLAALDWTLTAYLDGRAESEIPVVRQLLASQGELEVRALHLEEGFKPTRRFEKELGEVLHSLRDFVGAERIKLPRGWAHIG